jgi:hypothetical protein
MAHFIDLEDTQGDIIDREYYCSNSCAETSPNYKGWNGCHELDTPEVCQNCEGEVI